MSGADAPAPFRIAFDNARDPYTARNALGITSTGGGGGAPPDAQYITAAADPTLTNEMVLTDTATVTWDFSTPGQAKANATGGGGGGGNVSNSGIPVGGQYAKWVTSTTIQGVSPATVLSDIGAQPAGSYLTTAAAAATYQPLDADLTAIAALTGTNVIYYRSAANTWSAVTIGANLTFTGGTLAASGGAATTPGGSDTQVQFNDGGAFGGDADLVWNKTTNVLTLTGQITIVAGSATSISADGIVHASAFRTFGTNASLGPITAGNVTLRPNGVGSATGQLLIAASGAVTANGPISLPATGSQTATSLNFGTAGTGLFGAGSQINFSISNTQRLSLTTTDLTSTVRFSAPTGSALSASFNFGTSNTGLYGSATAISMTIANNNTFTVNATDLTVTVPITLPANPTTALQAATKQYVDTKAPLAAEYITSTADATLTAERVLTDTATVTWDRSTAGQIKANASAGGGSGVTVAVQKFTASGTYTPMSGMTYAIIECIGGGGGGGGANASANQIVAAGGGGAGAYSRRLVTAALVGASQTVTVGTGGNGGTATPGAGGTGNDTSVGTLCVAKGGAGAQAAANGATVAGGLGGAGASGTGDITASGAPGGTGIYSADALAQGGAGVGGSSIYGGGGRSTGDFSVGVVGVAATNYGSGGSGASSYNLVGKAGGAGSAGLVIITEYK